MAFAIRPYRRVAACCPLTYHVGNFEGHGTVWNLSRTGWRFSGNLPLRESEFCSLSVTLPNEQPVYVLTAQVCWVRGEEYGAHTISMDEDSLAALARYLDQELPHWKGFPW